VPLWVAIFLGWRQLTPASQPLLWHAHEVLFGFTVFAPGLLVASLVGAALAWSAAFLIYLWVFTPWLMRTRLDGKGG